LIFFKKTHDKAHEKGLRSQTYCTTFCDTVNTEALIQFFNIDIGEIDWIAMMLEGNRSAFGNSGELRLVNNRFIVQHDGDFIADHGDFKAVPAPDGIIGKQNGSDRPANLSRHVLIGTIPPDFTGTDGPVPDVDLTFRTAA